MNVGPERLVNALFEGNHCYNCGTPFLIDPSELDAEGDGVYITDYSCHGCESEYAITIEDQKEFLRLEYSTTDKDAPEELITTVQYGTKEALRRQADPVKDVVEGYIELNAALTLLRQNRKRLVHACDILREEGIDIQNEEFKRRVHADIHNYVASAYSFDKILNNVEPDLPTDGPVEDAVRAYEDEKKVIIGLRVYAQKQFTIPFTYAIFAGKGPDEWDTTIGVRLDDVKVIESDVEWFPPDGYRNGATHHYEKVDGEHINLERRVDLHYHAGEELVKVIAEHAEDVHGDEIDDYWEVNGYTAKRGRN